MRQASWGGGWGGEYHNPNKRLIVTLLSLPTATHFPLSRVCILTQEGKWEVHRKEDELQQSLCRMRVTYK